MPEQNACPDKDINMNGTIFKSVMMIIFLAVGLSSQSEDIELVKTKSMAYFAAAQYVKDKFSEKSIQQKEKDISVYIGTADRMMIKDFPDDIETLKVIAFMSAVYQMYAKKWHKTSENWEQIILEHQEQLSNEYRFDIYVIGKKISKYQTNYIDIRYSLKHNDQILFERHYTYKDKSVITMNFEKKTLDAVLQLFRDHSTLKFSIPQAFLYESSFGKKNRIWDLAMVVTFEHSKTAGTTCCD